MTDAVSPVIAVRPPRARGARLAAVLPWVSRREPLLFWALLLVHLAPVWAFPYLPTTDGPAHLANADILRKYHDPSLPALRRFYLISATPSPNLVGHLLLAGLLYVVPPLAAEKLVVSLIVVLLPLSARYAVRSIRPRAAALSFLAFPLVYSFLLGQGFYNFCLSLAAFFFLVGYWVRRRESLAGRRPWSAAVCLLALSFVLYACHLFSLLMACGVLAALAGWWWLREWARSGRPTGPALRRLVVTGAALLPSVAMALAFRPSARVETTFQDTPWSLHAAREDLLSVLQFSALVSFRKEEAYLGGVVAATSIGLALFALYVRVARRPALAGRRLTGGAVDGSSAGVLDYGSPTRARLGACFGTWDVLLLVAAGLFAFYLNAHDRLSLHFYIPPRVMVFLFVALLLWLAGQPMTRRVRGLVVPVAAAAALGLLASHALKYREFAPQFREFVSAGDHIPRGATFLPLVFSPQGRDDWGKPSASDVAPFYMASGYVAVRRDAIDLRNYEAKTDHFPVRFRPEVNPYKHMAIGLGLDTLPPKIDISGYESRSGANVDYVMVWGMTPELKDHPDTVDLCRQLAAGYDPVPLDGARRTELWKRKGR